MYNFSLTLIKKKAKNNTMCEGYEIPEKEVVPNKKLVEKEKQSNQEEKPLTVTA
jgi:hypothetical protein